MNRMPRRILGRIFVSLFLACALNMSQAQAGNSPQSAVPDNNQSTQQSAYTLRVNTRAVLIDVTVTHAKGNPAVGLSQSAFHVLDNKQPQSISSFEEHSGPALVPALPSSRPGIYSNEYLQHLPSVLNIIVLDITNLEIPDQMWLNQELTQFLKNVPNNQPLAIYLRSGENCFLVQNFTSDHTLLLDALHKAIPRFTPPGGTRLNDFDTMRQIAVYLGQIDGRKNVIWFSGGSALFLRPDADSAVFENATEWRNLYDELEQERIAIYPVDARGLTVTSDMGSIMGEFSQHTVMEDVARATGGHAFYNTNGMVEAANQVLNTAGSFYTLTYSPKDFQIDNKWHNVKVAVDGGPYRLSYRSGYFADGTVGGTEKPAKWRTRLMANGGKVEVLPQLRSVPIIFEATAMPLSEAALTALPPPSAATPPPPPTKPPRKGETRYSVRYSLPAAALVVQNVDGKLQVTFGIAAIAFDRDGQSIARQGERATMTLNKDSLREHPDGRIIIDQLIDLPRGDDYLYLAAWDVTTGRLGTLQVALDVSKPHKQASN
jgi:VWFA-related protein